MKSDEGDLDTIPHATSSHDSPVAGYELGDLIGRGGMGEVAHARDLTIDRDVAIKRMRGESTEDGVVRFMREAKIQARLDHPAIVPLYELGRDAAGRPYFTMKRITGVTLREHIANSASLQRLLRAFVDVALAVEYAHARGIIHRDLKPANIMLGDFGEVYVLDWGLARRTDDPADAAVPTVSTPAHGVTAIGALLGTPGYMPPEQIRDASSVGSAADVYALGAILFEILAGEPLHAPSDAMVSTLDEHIVRSPIQRRPDRAIPPELDALCIAALADQPATRPTARVLADQVQSYLDGDRDVALRRTMASGALDDARKYLVDDLRGDAMRSAARALALDPASIQAAELVTQMMLRPPDVPPPELVREFRASDAVHTRVRTRVAAHAYVGLLVLAIAATWGGVRDWMLAASIIGLVAALAVFAYAASIRRFVRPWEMWLYGIANVCVIGLISHACTPLFLAPPLACIVIASLCTYPAMLQHTRLVVLLVVAGWLVPIVLEAAGLAAPTWGVAGDAFVMQPAALEVNGTTAVWFGVANLAVIAICGYKNATLAHAARELERKIQSQRWHYSQLIPRAR